MFRISVFLCLVFFNISFAKEVSLTALSKTSDLSIDMNAEQALTLNGYRQAVTAELLDLKLDSELFWSKVDEKKLAPKDEIIFLKSLFENVTLLMNPETIGNNPATTFSGNFKGNIDSEKVKNIFLEITTNLGETKLKTFYIIANVDLEGSMSWEDVGVQKAESFRGVLLDSWKKLIEKDILGFEKVIVLEKDLSMKPDYLNTKSVTLKWTSSLKKVSSNIGNSTSSYELSAHYVLQNTKNGANMLAFDFPLQKREFGTSNKKTLSSALASLIYNLLLSQESKINAAVSAEASALETSELEVKIISKIGLSEIYQINSLLQEKFKEQKLSSQMKTYATDGSTLILRAEGSAAKILNFLSLNGGKIPFNEQKVLLFNPADKTFAILPKESNN